MKKFWTIAALACMTCMISCSSPEDKATDLAKQLKEVAGTDAGEVDKIMKKRSKYEDIFSDEQLDKYNAAWVAAIEKDAKEMASGVVSVVKDCDVVKAQEIEKKINEYKRVLDKPEELAKFNEVFNEEINDTEGGLTQEEMDKFNEAVYIWFHPLEKLVNIEKKASEEAAAQPSESESQEGEPVAANSAEATA